MIKLFIINFSIFIITILTGVLSAFNSTISSIFSLIIIYMITWVLLLLLEVEFLAMILFIIYIGAVAILFLFVTMMIGNNVSEKYKKTSLNNLQYPFLILAAIKLSICFDLGGQYHIYLGLTKLENFCLLYNMLYKSNDILIFSNLLYSYYIYLFIIACLVLLIGLVGSIVLAKNYKNILVER